MDIERYLESLPPSLDVRGTNRADLAKIIRGEIKGMIGSVLPRGVAVSVRKTDYKSIDVSIDAWPGSPFSPSYVEWLMAGYTSGVARDRWPEWRTYNDRVRMHDGHHGHMSDGRYLPDVDAAICAVTRVANRHNYDNSDIQTDYFDVGYYLSVGLRTLEANAELGIRMECDVAFADLHRRATEAASILGDAVVTSVCGRGGVDGSGEWSWNRLLKLLDKARNSDGTYQRLAYDKRMRTWCRTTTPYRGKSDAA